MTFFSASEVRGGRQLSPRRSVVVSVLDVGTNKTCCLIARLRPKAQGEALPGRSHLVEILGVGHTRSRGVKSGVIVDLEAAEGAIRLAVDAAERMASVTVESLLVSVSCGRLASETYAASIEISGREVGEADIARVLAAGRGHKFARGRVAIHAVPIGYALDGNRGVRDPRGMIGTELAVEMHMVTGESAPLGNLELAVNRCHLSVEKLVAAPYVSALATMVDDESELGCVAIDLGAGTTSMAVFSEGHLVHADAIALGGQHVTTDIARGLSTRIEDAERLKTMHGSSLALSADERETVSVAQLGEDDREGAGQVPRSTLNHIIAARIEEILEVVRDRLNASGFAGTLGRRMVLTGGASQLAGLSETARRILARDIRLGRPLGVRGLPEFAKGPAFAACVGLLIYPQAAGLEQVARTPMAVGAMTGTGGYFSRVGQWIRESF